VDALNDASGTATRPALSDTEREALETMRDNIARAQRFVEGFDLAAFLADEKTFYAVARCIEIIKEAGGRVPPSFIYPESWECEDDPDASVLIHGFFRQEWAEGLWSVIHDMPALRAAIDVELPVTPAFRPKAKTSTVCQAS